MQKALRASLFVLSAVLFFGASAPSAFAAPAPVVPFNVVSNPTNAVLYTAVVKAADHLLAQQNLDGGWSWYGTPSTPSDINLWGVTGLGLLNAYQLTHNATYLTGAKKTADHLVAIPTPTDLTTDGTNKFYSSDIEFLAKIGSVSGDTTYSDKAIAVMTHFLSEPNRYCATGCANAQDIADTYHGWSPAPEVDAEWQIAGWVEAAKLTGNDTWGTALATILKADVLDPVYAPTLSLTANKYYALGLASALRATASYSIGNTDIQTKLLAEQDGTTGAIAANTSDGINQATAYSVLGLSVAADSSHATAGAHFLAGNQNLDGGWTESDTHEYTEVNSEIIQALFSVLPANTFYTIQDAINAATAGNPINVGAGTYPESVLLNRTLTITGAAGAVVTGTSTANYIFKIEGIHDGATISGLEINGGGSTRGSNTFDYGVLVNNSGTNTSPVELKNLTVKNVWNTSGNGIEVDGTFGSYALIHDSVVSSFDKRGIRFIDAGGKVYANEVTGDNVDGTSRVQNLVNLWGGSVVEIYGNKLHNALTTGLTPTWDSPAVFVSSYGGSGPSMANIHDNEIYACDTGVTLGSVYASTDTSSATITNNTFHDLNWAINLEKGTVMATVHKNSFGTNIAKAVNSDDGSGTGGPTPKASVDGTLNWWGSASGPTVASNPSGTGGIIYDTVSYSPWYIDAARTMVRLTVTTSGGEASTTLPDAITETGSDDGVTVTAEIPGGTVITGDASWDGVITAPTATTTPIVTVEDGYSSTVTSAISVGSSDSDLTFDKAVKLTFAGQAGKRIGWYNHAGVFSEITSVCAANDQTTGDALAAGTSCKIDASSDLVVWTKHFSTFTTYSSTISTPVISPSGAVFHGSANVTMDNSTSPAAIRYTTDGSEPVCGGGSGYTNGQVLTFSSSVVLKAIRCDGVHHSAIATATFSPAAGGGDSGSGSGSGSGGGSIGIVPVAPLVPAAPAPAPVVTPAAPEHGEVLGAAAFNFTKNLSVGARGAEVTALQQFLSDNKFFSETSTGYFGQLTKKAVIAFQKARGISQTGNVGPLTRAELNKGTVAVAPETHSGSKLTADQVTSILGLLQSFGADQSVIDSTRLALAR